MDYLLEPPKWNQGFRLENYLDFQPPKFEDGL